MGDELDWFLNTLVEGGVLSVIAWGWYLDGSF